MALPSSRPCRRTGRLSSTWAFGTLDRTRCARSPRAGADLPAAVVSRATWDDERTVMGTLGTLGARAKRSSEAPRDRDRRRRRAGGGEPGRDARPRDPERHSSCRRSLSAFNSSAKRDSNGVPSARQRSRDKRACCVVIHSASGSACSSTSRMRRASAGDSPDVEIAIVTTPRRSVAQP